MQYENHRKERAQAREKTKTGAQMTLMEKAAQLVMMRHQWKDWEFPPTITGMRLCTVWQEREQQPCFPSHWNGSSL